MKTVEEALKVNAELSKVEDEIEKIKGRMNFLKDRAAYSTLTIGLEPVQPSPTPTPTATVTSTFSSHIAHIASGFATKSFALASPIGVARHSRLSSRSNLWERTYQMTNNSQDWGSRPISGNYPASTPTPPAGPEAVPPVTPRQEVDPGRRMADAGSFRGPEWCALGAGADATDRFGPADSAGSNDFAAGARATAAGAASRAGDRAALGRPLSC